MAAETDDNISIKTDDDPADPFTPPPPALTRNLIGLLVAIILVLAVLAIDEVLSASAVPPQQIETVSGPIASLRSLAPGACYAFPLLEKQESEFLQGRPLAALLSWTTSGILHDDHIYLADLGFSRFAKAPIGGYVETAASELRYDRGGKTAPLVAPWYVYPRLEKGGTFTGYVLSDLADDASSRVLFVDRDGRVEDVLETWGRELVGPNGDAVVIIDVLRMVPAASGLVVNADFISAEDFQAKEGGNYWNAFAFLDRGPGRERYLPLAFEGDGDKEAHRVLKEKYYGRDLTYMAIVDGTVYVLMMEDDPWIGRVDLERLIIERLPLFPAGLEMPSFSIKNERGEMILGIDRLLAVYRAIEDHAMPVGLYSWRDRLFILSKGAADENNGSTRWELVEVSPRNGQDLNLRVPLPTRAEHIALVLGEEHLGIIEKGPISSLSRSAFPWQELYRQTGSAVLLNVGPWLDRPFSDQDEVWQQCRQIEVGS